MSTESERTKQGTMDAAKPVNDEKTTEVTLWLDNDIIEKFKASGDGWQTRINAVLRNAVANGATKS